MTVGDGRDLIVQAWPARRNGSHNPFQVLLADALERCTTDITVQEFIPSRPFRKANVWHWHWPDAILNGPFLSATAKLIYSIALMRLARVRRIPIVWTAHNAASHAGRHPRLEGLLWRIFMRHVGAVHYLSESSREEISGLWPRLTSIPSVVTNHGVYPVVRALELPKIPHNDFIIAFVGKISPYKGVPELIQAFDALAAPDVHLLVAGDLNSDLAGWAAGRSRDGARETWITRLLTDVELAGVYSVADLIVLPYRAVTNSGSVMHALSAGKRVLAPALGSIPEIASIVGADWLLTYEGTISPDILADAISWVRRGGASSSPDLRAFQWEGVAEKLATLYRKTLSPAIAGPHEAS